ncbi:protein DpdG [Nonomuraea angiospora]|uniref:protein DpdG n=1 Tax=Nonomuraea angiospora TaxID=46172 RepID=UPI0029AF3CA7|nr:protein DpdG [Nonomuraea angiospora]MDX3106010.1 protein DpdG [Nonomuraea angiospora]
MAVLNPPRSLPGLGRAIINFLIESKRSWTEEELIEAFKPPGLNDSSTAPDGIKNTLLAFRTIGMLSLDKSGEITVCDPVADDGTILTPAKFRRALQIHAVNLERDGDPWQTRPGEGHTSGARDLARALSWFLAQDALGRPLSWTDNVQTLQQAQFPGQSNETWAITNDTRWGAFSRWALALGMASPSLLLRAKTSLVPLPVVAIDDVLDELPAGQSPIGDFLARLTTKLPILHGGLVRTSLAESLPGGDPDPGIAKDCADSSVGQALRVLEDRGRLVLDTLPDADGVRLSRFDSNRQTHVTLLRGGGR